MKNVRKPLCGHEDTNCCKLKEYKTKTLFHWLNDAENNKEKHRILIDPGFEPKMKAIEEHAEACSTSLGTIQIAVVSSFRYEVIF